MTEHLLLWNMRNLQFIANIELLRFFFKINSEVKVI